MLVQKCQRPSTTYMERVQTDVDPSMRAVLIDWLVEVAQVCTPYCCSEYSVKHHRELSCQ